MSKREVRVVAATLVVLAVVMGIYILSSPGSISKAQNRVGDLRELLQQLVDDDIAFLIEFATPVSEGRSYWTIPGDIENEGSKMGRRFVREIGYNYICVDEIGQGATTTICVPFANIAYVTYTP